MRIINSFTIASIQNNVGIQLNHSIDILIFRYFISMHPIVREKVSAHVPIAKRPLNMRLQGYLEIHTKLRFSLNII